MAQPDESNQKQVDGLPEISANDRWLRLGFDALKIAMREQSQITRCLALAILQLPDEAKAMVQIEEAMRRLNEVDRWIDNATSTIENIRHAG